MGKFIIICSTCRLQNEPHAKQGEAQPEAPSLASDLARQLKPLAPDWQIELHPCLSMCAKPLSLAVKSTQKATYLFSGLTRDDLGDIQTFLSLYDAAPDGWIEDAKPLGRLRFCLTGRIPATDD